MGADGDEAAERTSLMSSRGQNVPIESPSEQPLLISDSEVAPPYSGLIHAGSSFMGSASITLAGTALGGVFAMVDEALLARFLHVDAYGLYAIGFMLARIGSIVAAFGLPVTILHFMPVYLSQHEKDRALGSIIGSLLMPLLFGGILALSLWLLGDWLAMSVFREPRAALYIRQLALVVPLLALTEVLGHVARGFGRALPYVLIRNIAPQLCYMAVLIHLMRSGGSPIAVTHGLLGAYLVGSTLGLLFVIRYTWSGVGRIRPKLELRRLYTYALPVFLGSAVSLALFWTDLFQLGIFTNANTVGIYRACMQIIVVFDSIWAAYAAAVGPIYPVQISQGRYDQLRNTYLAAVHLATLLATPVFLLILCNSRDLLGIMGPRFVAGAAALSILAFGHLIKVALGPAGLLLILGGKQRLEAGNTAVAALLNIALNLILIPRIGLAGAATATTTSLVVLSGLRLFQVARSYPVAALDPAVFKVVVVTVPIALATEWLSAMMGVGEGTGVEDLLLRLVTMISLITVAIWFVCLKRNERAMLLGLFKFGQLART